MDEKLINRVLMIGGGLLLALSLTADMIGIGGRPGFGWKQLSGCVAGLAALLAGYWRAHRKTN